MVSCDSDNSSAICCVFKPSFIKLEANVFNSSMLNTMVLVGCLPGTAHQCFPVVQPTGESLKGGATAMAWPTSFEPLDRARENIPEEISSVLGGCRLHKL